jgi:hypothetical protein
MGEQKFVALDAPHIKKLAKLYPDFQRILGEFEQTHGAEWADVALIILDCLRTIQKPERYSVGLEILDAKLRGDKDNMRRSLAKSAALVRHAENHAMKAQVFEWLDENMSRYRSMDAAAEAMAGKLVPVTFRTVRAWVSEWKKQRSAGRP